LNIQYQPVAKAANNAPKRDNILEYLTTDEKDAYRYHQRLIVINT